MRTAMFCWAYLVSFGMAGVSQGDLITFSYEAAEIGGSGSVVGTFVFDDSIPDSLPANQEFGLFPGAGSWSGDVDGGTLDGVHFEFFELGVSVFNFSNPAFDSLNMNIGASSVLISDLSGSAFSTDSLPVDLNLEHFDSASLLLNIDDIVGNEGPTGPPSVLYTLTSIQQVVPEPTHAALLGMVTLAVGAIRRRRQEC